jgi:heat shock protein HslJ
MGEDGPVEQHADAGSAGSPVPWGTQWDLVAAADGAVDATHHLVTLGFQDGRAGGRAPVNRYFGMCQEIPDGGLALGPFGLTMMAGPPEAMAAEVAYMRLLEQAAGLHVADGELVLRDAAGRALLIYQPSVDPQ